MECSSKLNSQWQYSGNHYVFINTGGEGDVTDNFGTVYATHPGGDYDEFVLLCGLTVDCLILDTLKMTTTNQIWTKTQIRVAWASKKRFAEAVGGRLPTIEEVRARKFRYNVVIHVTSDIWVPCTNSAYDGQATDPSADYVQIGTTTSHYFGKSTEKLRLAKCFRSMADK